MLSIVIVIAMVITDNYNVITIITNINIISSLSLLLPF